MNRAINLFFLGDYFGIDGSENRYEIISIVVDKACGDATVQGAFDLRQDLNRNKKISIKENVIRETCGAISSLSSYDSYSRWHEETCTEVVKSGFSFGNAQKIVNMAIKYLYLIAKCSRQLYRGSTDFLEWYDDRLKRFEADLHVTIDNYVLQYFYEDNRNRNTHWGDTENIKIMKSHPTYYIKDKMDNNMYVWSAIPDYDLYMRVQRSILSCYSFNDPTEWENEIWLEIAKKRKNKYRKN